MTVTVDSIYDALYHDLSTTLGINASKGYPDWARPAVTLPIMALEYLTWQPVARGRIGQRETQQTVQYRGWLFARHEPELGALLASFAAWVATHALIILESQRIITTVEGAQRYVAETMAQQERHAFVWTITAAYNMP